MINEDKLKKLLKRSKHWIIEAREMIGTEAGIKLLRLARSKAEEACIVVAEFKCQKCGKEKDLTIHHMIIKKAAKFMDKKRYLSQRYYWANMILLCRECHHEYHETLGIDIETMGVISQDKINKLKKRYLK